VDRSLGGFLRGQIVLALVVGLLTYAGVRSLELLGFQGVAYPLPLASVATVLNLVPVVGPIASTLIAATAALLVSPATAAAIVGVYILVQISAGRIVGPGIDKSLLNVHPGVMAVIAVVLSQFGLGWALLTTPIVAIARGLFLYAYGRVSDPPRPAGLLPGEEPKAAKPYTASSAPLVYRRARQQRSGEATQI
jgi:predicted PurR-regulated permease PerM